MDHSIFIFKKIWEHIGVFPKTKAQYALQWMWEDEAVLKIFVNKVLGIDEDVNKALLCNGYRDCKKYESQVFPPDVWKTIDNVFTNKLSMTHLSQPFRKEIATLSMKTGNALRSHLEKRIEYLSSNARCTHSDVSVGRMCKSDIKSMVGYFSGDWEKHGMDLISETDLPFCKSIPTKFTVLNTSTKMTYVYDRSGKQPILVGMLLKEAIWRQEEKDYIRFLMSQLMVAHNEIKRQSCAVLDGAMVAYGLHFHTWEKLGGKKISFYKPKAEVKRLYSRMGLQCDFGEFVDRHAHSKLVNILLGMFSSYCPSALRSFFEYGDPYMPLSTYEVSELEKVFGGLGPCAYQLFVTENYVSEYHTDDDATEFTLAYASHPDASKTSHIDFHLAEVGLRFEVGDGDAYIFRTDYGHATGYRRPSENAAYVGCVTVNSNLRNLMRRRQLL